MSYAIDIILVLIIVFFAWRGFKKGLLRAVLGILAVIVALYGASYAAKTFSGELTSRFEPLVSGVVEKAVSKTLSQEKASDAASESTTSDSGSTQVYHVSFDSLRELGVSTKAAGKLADQVGAEIKTVGEQMTSNLTHKLSGSLSYITVFAAVFIIILIIFAIIGYLINVAYIIPGIEATDRMIGLILGVLKGALLVFAIAVIIRYVGLLSPEAINKTIILKYLTNNNPLATLLGI